MTIGVVAIKKVIYEKKTIIALNQNKKNRIKRNKRVPIKIIHKNQTKIRNFWMIIGDKFLEKIIPRIIYKINHQIF